MSFALFILKPLSSFLMILTIWVERETDSNGEDECQTEKEEKNAKRGNEMKEIRGREGIERWFARRENLREIENEWSDRMITSRTVDSGQRQTGLRRDLNPVSLSSSVSGIYPTKVQPLQASRNIETTTGEQGSNRMAMFHPWSSLPCFLFNLMWQRSENILSLFLPSLDPLRAVSKIYDSEQQQLKNLFSCCFLTSLIAILKPILFFKTFQETNHNQRTWIIILE